MKQGFNINFYARECKRTKSGQAPLEISININGQRKFMNLPFKIAPEVFNRKRRPKEVEDYMAAMRTRINEILAEMAQHGEAVTTRSLIDYLKNGGYRSYAVETLFSEYIDIMESRVEAGTLTKYSLTKYKLVRDLFYEVVDRTGECEKEITHAAVMKFKFLCEGKYEQATTAGYLKRLKSIIIYALENGKIKINPFNGIRIKRGTKPIVYLTPEEQRKLIDTKIDNESLERVRQAAIIQMSTGMSYADLKEFRKCDIKQAGDVYYVEKPRQKTGKTFTAVILPEGVKVLNGLDEINIISNAKYNLYLKTLQDICGIKTKLTTHVFRRTYSTELLNRGVRIDTVAAAIGDNIATVKRHYAELKKDTIISEISRVI